VSAASRGGACKQGRQLEAGPEFLYCSGILVLRKGGEVQVWVLCTRARLW
jgi:hypothetical protein